MKYICGVLTPTLEKEMAVDSSIFVWEIPRTEQRAGCSPWGLKGSDTT